MNARPRSSRRLLAVVAALALTGCGTPDGPKVATAQQPTITVSAEASAPAKETDYDKALRFTRCMTEHGAPTPDPVEGKELITGSFQWKTYRSVDLSESPEVREAKFRASVICEKFLPTTWPIKVDPKEIARTRPFNECLKKHGFPQPEPDANGMVHQPLLGGRPKTEWDPATGGSTPEFEAAQEACRYALDDLANGKDS